MLETFEPLDAFCGFSVDDLAKAKQFYHETLGLEVNENNAGFTIQFPKTGSVFVYTKPNHQPASYTNLNFIVSNIEAAVDSLITKGVHFERYDGMQQDEKGIAYSTGEHSGPPIAWFKDPAGNILALIQRS